jgi:hypothetical protein
VILDAKSTAQAKFSQQVQVAFYFLLLKAIIADENIKGVEVSNMGIFTNQEKNKAKKSKKKAIK